MSERERGREGGRERGRERKNKRMCVRVRERDRVRGHMMKVRENQVLCRASYKRQSIFLLHN